MREREEKITSKLKENSATSAPFRRFRRVLGLVFGFRLLRVRIAVRGIFGARERIVATSRSRSSARGTPDAMLACCRAVAAGLAARDLASLRQSLSLVGLDRARVGRGDDLDWAAGPRSDL